jgi:glycerol-3-phosphate dehydrogenase
MNFGPAWTATEPLPGGDLGPGGLHELIAAIQAVHPYVAPALARRLARAYGTRVWTLLGSAARMEDLGHCVVGDMHARELDYLRHEEWAVTADDVLWRRTKLGLCASAAEVEALHAAFAGTSDAHMRVG